MKQSIKVLSEAVAVVDVAAQHIESRIREAAVREETFVLGLATGATMRPLFESLVRRHQEAGISFSNVLAFHLDEYWPLERDDPAGFAASLEASFIRKVDFRPSSFTPFPALVGSEECDKSCVAYCEAITVAGGVDLQLVGVGANGHLAFNEPGSNRESRARKVDLAPETLARMPEGVNYKEALTLGVADILEAKEILFIATGLDKSKAVRQALVDPPSADCPASFLQSHPSVTWLMDDASASLLQSGDFED